VSSGMGALIVYVMAAVFIVLTALIIVYELLNRIEDKDEQ
jgi:Na+-transporting methylmalonyl-CoA/oxaloacetate decarboxylase gamma subunit